MAGPLSDIVVLDLTRVLAGPLCTQTLADLGARVIKVERPGAGDDTRGWGPPWTDGEGPGGRRDSVYYTAFNRGKESITADLATPEGQEIVRELAKRADVVVENYKVGDLARHGLGWEHLSAINPRLIYCSITGYGQTGPYASRPGYDFVFQGEGGMMSVTGERDDVPGGGPQKVGVAVTDIATGLYSTIAVVSALHHRDATGRGQYVDMALLDCIAALGANHATTYLATGKVPSRMGNAHAVMVPYQTFRTLDGHMIVAVGNDAQYGRYCDAIGRPDLAADPRFATVSGRVVDRAVLVPELEKVMATRTTDDWIGRLSAADVPHGAINDYRRVFEHPQLVHRGARVEIPDGRGGAVPAVASPLRFSDTPVEYRSAPPRLGEHTRAVLADVLGWSDERIDALAARGAI